MISNQILQKTIDKIKGITGCELAMLNLNGEVAVRTFTDENIDAMTVSSFSELSAEKEIVGNYTLFKIKEDNRNEYILAVRNGGTNPELVGELVKYHLETILEAYKERFDKDNFFKSLLLDNMLMIDIFDRAKKLHINVETYRAAMIIESKEKKYGDVIETIRGILSSNGDDFVTAINKKDIIVIKKVDSAKSYEQLESVAKKIQNALVLEQNDSIMISYGSIVSDLKEVSKSYKEARMAMDVSRIFYVGRSINSYNKLGIGRLIYQLPVPLCKLFINEVVKNMSIDDLDDETILTINKFFENSLNVSETSRQLYIHRNTLVYRLDKIQKLTGLDLRVFDDAITFKIALMVSEYMKYVQDRE